MKLPECAVPQETGIYVYILQCGDGSLYTGWTTHIPSRLAAHNGEKGAGRGARCTRGRRPVRLVYYETLAERSDALKREAQIKKLKRSEKLHLINRRKAEEMSLEESSIERLVDELKKNCFQVRFFKNRQEAADYLDSEIRGKTVGFGDSGTLMELGLYERLSQNNTVYDPMHRKEGQDFYETADQTLLTQVFLTSANAVSETGELVNIDGTGNRVAGSLYGHERVIFVVGINKIEPSLERAIWRARNVAAPRNAKRLGKKTPCAVKGDRCYNCSSPERICNSIVVHMKQMTDMDTEIVLIDEELGL